MFSLIAVALSAFLAAPLATSLQSARRVDQLVRSGANPAITVRVDASLPFLGRVELDVRGLARAEQFYFAEIHQGKLGRTVVVHFEHFLPSNDLTFEYPTFRMARLGGHDYLHQTWPGVDFEMLSLEPVKALLAARGVTAESGWLVNRYARVVDDAGKHEILIFYLEPGSSSPVPLETLSIEAPPSGVPQKPGSWMTVANALAGRARAVITVEDEGRR